MGMDNFMISTVAVKIFVTLDLIELPQTNIEPIPKLGIISLKSVTGLYRGCDSYI